MVFVRLLAAVLLWAVLSALGMTLAAFLLPVHIASWAPLPVVVLAVPVAIWLAFPRRGACAIQIAHSGQNARAFARFVAQCASSKLL